MPNRILRTLLIAGLTVAACSAWAQDGGGGEARAGRGQFGGQRVIGEVTAVSGASLTIKSEDGTTYTVTTTDNTRVMKGRGETEKVGDIKPGDAVTAAGNLDAPSKTMHAAILMVVDAATVKAMKDNLGKTYILGKVTAIDADNAKMTVERQDKVSQTIGFDETTSFKRGRVGMGAMGGGMGMGRPGGGAGGGAGAGGNAPADSGESITLADIKVGDTISGQGSVKNGTFVPATLTVATPGQGGGRRGGQGAPGAGTQTPPPAAAASGPPPSGSGM